MALFNNPTPTPIIPKIKTSGSWDLCYWWYRSTYHIVHCFKMDTGGVLCVLSATGGGGLTAWLWTTMMTLNILSNLQFNKTDLQFGSGTVFHFRFGGGWSTGARASGIDWLRLKIANIDPFEKLGIFKLLIKKFYQVLLKTKIFVIFHLVRFTAEGGSSDTVTW